MNEMGKKERLRNGEAVELKPGIFGRINKQNRTLELDSGKVLPISQQDQRDLFPENEQSLDVSRRTEKLEGQVKKAPFGEFLHQFGQSGVLSAPKDWLDYLTKTGDQYLASKEASRRVSERISNESPITSGAATVASFVPDLMLTRGMSAAKAAPLLTAASAGSRIVSEPENVAKESLVAAGTGKILDIGASALSKIAARRGASRSLPVQKQSVAESNRLGQEAVNEANALQTSEFNALKQNIKEVNQQRLMKYQEELDSRQNRMIEARNQRDAAQFASAQEKKRINEEFKLAEKQYKESLADLPRVQREAQQEYSKNVIQNAEGVEKAFPKGSKITGVEVDVPGFFDNTVRNSGNVATTGEAQSKRILTSLFPQSENFTAKELASKYTAIEEAIQKGSPEVKTILNQFKNHLGDKLPFIVADNISFNRVIPSLRKQIEKDIESSLKKIPNMQGFASSSLINTRIKSNLNNYFNELTPQNFVQKLKNGELREEILTKMIGPFDVAAFSTSGVKKKTPLFSSEVEAPQAFISAQENIKQQLMGKIDNAIARAEIKTIASDVDASTRLGAKVRNTYGMAEPVAPPTPPSPPEPMALPGSSVELPRTPTLTMPQRPSLISEPIAPAPQRFTSQPEPTLAPANGMAERMGDFLEQGIGGGKPTLMNNPITKLASLKYLLGPAALPVEAAGAAGYLGAKGLTSPTAAGAVARATFKQGGIMAIDSWAQRYPSYKNGILESPQDRRSLTKEVEDDFEIPIEQKAVIQSKINRGKPIQERL